MGTLPYFRVRRGQSRLEKRAIDAHLARLGLRVCRETRNILDPGRARGGFEGLRNAALAAGNARVLGLDALSRVKERRSIAASLGLGSSRKDEARAELQRASGSLVRAAKGLRSLCERYLLTLALERRQLIAVTRELNTSLESLRAVFEGALGFATPGDLEQITRAYAQHVEACGHYHATFEELIDTAFPATRGTLMWLGKPNAPAIDPLEEQSRNALTSMRTMLLLGELFVRREASHLTAARKAPPSRISDSSRSIPST